jgi:hypothetical protein
VEEEAVHHEADPDELDRILAKIKTSGRESLSARERDVLRDATERQRRDGRTEHDS